MAVNFIDDAPEIIKEFLFYELTIKGRSKKTVDEYFFDLRTFFKFYKKTVSKSDLTLDEINIDDIDIETVKSVTYNDIIQFMGYIKYERNNQAAARSRKSSTLRQFYQYLTVYRRYFDNDPTSTLENPKLGKKARKYLTLEQSIELLNSVEGKNKERDYCILTLFLNCGLRLEELVSLNMNSIRSDNSLFIKGKGNKERIIFLNDSCVNALNEWRKVRPNDSLKDRDALFISSHRKRLSRESVQKMVHKYLDKIGLESQGYSCHKLRHTAATLMFQHGNVDVRVLQEILGHENLGTTQIYTHINPDQLKKATELNPLSKLKNKKNSD